MEKIASFMTDSYDIPPIKPISREQFDKLQCDWYNELSGNMPYMDCHKCKNKGYIACMNDVGDIVHRECECMKIRRNFEAIHKSGLEQVLKHCTFEKFSTPELWQQRIKKKALDYLLIPDNKWLYVSGQSGCGKTHICTAICGDLMESGRTVKYVMWRDILHELQGLQFKADEYQQRINEIQKIDVLYIDDFLKNIDKSKMGTNLDFALEIINKRYVADHKTIISTELLIDDISAMDTALSRRIIEKSAGYIIQVKRDTSRNYSLKK